MSTRLTNLWAMVAASLVVLVSPLAVLSDDTFYASSAGPYSVVNVESVPLAMSESDRIIEVRVAYPDGGEVAFPLIMFSHGTFSSKDMYAPVVDHWVSHGYVVMLPNHRDANFGWMPSGEDSMHENNRSRAADLSFLVDNIDQIVAAVPELEGKIDHDHLIAAGHAVGSLVAMYNTGLELRHPNTGEVVSHEEDRFDAVVMLSDPGKMALQPDDLWKGSTVPTFLGTGTEDYGTQGKGNRPTTYTRERLSGDDAPPNSKYILVLDKGDHYFGGLIHRKREGVGPPDHEGLAIFNSLSVAFLDSVIKQKEAAQKFLAESDFVALTNGRATLTIE